VAKNYRITVVSTPIDWPRPVRLVAAMPVRWPILTDDEYIAWRCAVGRMVTRVTILSGYSSSMVTIETHDREY
jgi:hypothetical protein